MGERAREGRSRGCAVHQGARGGGGAPRRKVARSFKTELKLRSEGLPTE